MAREKTYQTDIRKARKQQQRKRKMRRLIAITAVACIALATVLTSEAWLPKLKNSLKGAADKVTNKDSNVEHGEFPIDIGETNNSEVYTFGDNLALVTDTNVIIFDKDGNKLKSVQHKLANPIGVCGEDMVLLYDKGGYSLMTIGKDGEVYSKMFTEQIILAKLGSTDYAAVVTQTDKYAAYLTVYDAKGKETFLWSNTQRVTDLTLNAEGNGCILTSIKAKDGQLWGSVTALSFTQTEPVFTIDNIPAMIYDTVYSQEGSFWALSDTRLMHMSQSGEIISQYDFDTALKAAAMDTRIAAVVEKGVTRESFELTVAFSQSTDIKKHVIEGECKQMLCYDNKIYILTNDSMFVFDEDGEQSGRYKVSSDYSSFVIIDGEVFAKDYQCIYKVDLSDNQD